MTVPATLKVKICDIYFLICKTLELCALELTNFYLILVPIYFHVHISILNTLTSSIFVVA
jgi:hypothetical protein